MNDNGNEHSEIMTPAHPRWQEFYDRLSGPEGCDFKDDMTWLCSGKDDRPFAAAILKSMAMDIEASLNFFDDNHGYCDCEILFNVDDGEW